MASLFGGGTTTTNQTSTTQPWSVQQPYLEAGLNAAQNTYQADQAQGPYQGQFVAGTNGYFGDAQNQATNFVSSQGNQLVSGTGNTAQNLQSAATPYVSNAEGLEAGIAPENSALASALQGYGTGATTTQGPSSALGSALNNAAVTGANAIGNYNSGLSNAAATASGDATGQITADAGQYMNSAPVQSAINSTNAGIQQVLNEQTLPGLNQVEGSQGDINSSRAGMEEGLAKQAAATAQGTADASILNNAYNTGVGAATNTYDTNLGGAISSNQSGLLDNAALANNVGNLQTGVNEFNTTSQLGAANSGLSNALNYSLGNANTQLSANNQLGTGAAEGIAGASTASGLEGNDYNLLSGAGTIQQNADQSALTNALDQYNENQQQPYTNLDNYWQIAGTPLGSTTNSSGTQTQSGSVLGGLLGLGLAGTSLFGTGGLSAGISGIGNALGLGSSGINYAGLLPTQITPAMWQGTG